jgi:hypothetical protein
MHLAQKEHAVSDIRQALEHSIRLEALSRVVEEEELMTGARVDLAAARMFAELSAASEWLAERARYYTLRAHRQIADDVFRSNGR